MPFSKRKVFSRFAVGAMMKARRQAPEQMAAAHESIQTLKKNVESLMAKCLRLETKVSFPICS